MNKEVKVFPNPHRTHADCFKCGAYTPYFSIHAELWYTTSFPHGNEHICLPCFCKLLGRHLYEDEFLLCPMNINNLEYIQQYTDHTPHGWLLTHVGILKAAGQMKTVIIEEEP
jgi:hypothetical protein